MEQGLLQSLVDSKKPIAVVDDNVDDQDLMQREIEFLFGKREILRFRNGMSLLRHLEAHSLQEQLPALILLDINLSGVDGISVLEYLRNNDRYVSIPVVVVSGTSDAYDIQAAKKHGANGFLPKPVFRGDFIKILNGKGTILPPMYIHT